jgi:ABC-type transport system involved in multi-copper enzyme maturation permease subunit
MLKTIAWKEFRELLPFIVLAIVTESYLVCLAVGVHLGLLSSVSIFQTNTYNLIPFIEDSYCTQILAAAALFAVVIALWQTLWESYHGTFQFVLHRPIPRNNVIGAKITVGIILSSLVAGVPLLYYALWAATPGSHDAPFTWSMTWQYWFVCSQIPMIYLSAFLSGMRSARWFASRFFRCWLAFSSSC